MSKEEQKAYIAALLKEREGYEKYGLTDRVEEVDAELDRLGHKAKPPAKRAAKMTAKKGAEL